MAGGRRLAVADAIVLTLNRARGLSRSDAFRFWLKALALPAPQACGRRSLTFHARAQSS